MSMSSYWNAPQMALVNAAMKTAPVLNSAFQFELYLGANEELE
jgi:hypothetical protein